ncbi:MAG TPA: adenosylhomocysteinase [Conexibacter sp.]|nr:adenosylhomocysteinase [Conexibacter sp.]
MSDGAARIAWARARMPVLAAVAADATALADRRIAISLPLDPTTAVLALTLRDAGAQVAVHAPAAETDDAVADALAHAGVAVFARSDATAPAAAVALLDGLLDTRPDLLVDDGAHALRRVHDVRRDVLATLRGGSEQTTSGVRPLRALADAGELAIPVLAVDDARTKRIADNGHGTGQSCVAAVLDVSGILLGGKAVAVAGYGPVGRSVARHAAALGARVTVSEIDPHRALEALLDGHAVAPLARAAPSADLLFSATGIARTVPLGVLRALPDGALVAVAGGVAGEVEVDALRAAADGPPQPLARDLDAYRLDGRRLLLVADGECVNVAAAEGNPIEAMDCSLALQALALAHLAGDGATLAPGLHPLPTELDAHVARLRLAAAGAELEPRSATERMARDWR